MLSDITPKRIPACFSLASIIQTRANDPCEGQPALVDMIQLSDVMEQYLLNLKQMNDKYKLKKVYGFREPSVKRQSRSPILGRKTPEILPPRSKSVKGLNNF